MLHLPAPLALRGRSSSYPHSPDEETEVRSGQVSSLTLRLGCLDSDLGGLAPEAAFGVMEEWNPEPGVPSIRLSPPLSPQDKLL